MKRINLSENIITMIKYHHEKSQNYDNIHGIYFLIFT